MTDKRSGERTMRRSVTIVIAGFIAAAMGTTAFSGSTSTLAAPVRRATAPAEDVPARLVASGQLIGLATQRLMGRTVNIPIAAGATATTSIRDILYCGAEGGAGRLYAILGPAANDAVAGYGVLLQAGDCGTASSDIGTRLTAFDRRPAWGTVATLRATWADGKLRIEVADIALEQSWGNHPAFNRDQVRAALPTVVELDTRRMPLPVAGVSIPVSVAMVFRGDSIVVGALPVGAAQWSTDALTQTSFNADGMSPLENARLVLPLGFVNEMFRRMIAANPRAFPVKVADGSTLILYRLAAASEPEGVMFRAGLLHETENDSVEAKIRFAPGSLTLAALSVEALESPCPEANDAATAQLRLVCMTRKVIFKNLVRVYARELSERFVGTPFRPFQLSTEIPVQLGDVDAQLRGSTTRGSTTESSLSIGAALILEAR